MGNGTFRPGIGRYDSDAGVEVYVDYCPCRKGRAMAQERASALKEAFARRKASAIARVWEHSGVPTRLRAMRLETSPHADLAKRLKAPSVEDDNFDRLVLGWRRSWFFWGPYGTGKTGLAIGYALEWLEFYNGGSAIRFRAVPDMLMEIRDTYSPAYEGPSEYDLIKRYGSDDCLLVLDDFGAEQIKASNREWAEDRLYQIINRRHGGQATTIFTANISLEEISRRIGERIVWRIVEMCGRDHIVHVEGKNLRELE